MDLQRKEFISLKTLKLRAENFSRIMLRTSNLNRISQATDMPPDQILIFFNQFLGKTDIAFKKEEAGKIAWTMMKAMLREGILHDGINKIIDHTEETADAIGISQDELKEFFRETLSIIIGELFPSETDPPHS